MGKRCEDIGCGYLAMDGSCLLSKTERASNCPARETVHNEHKDIWMINRKVKE